MSGGKTGSTFETFRGGKNIGIDKDLHLNLETNTKREANRELDKR